MDVISYLPVFLGALVGLLLGMTGAGGGILAVPLLVFGLGMTVADAAPISLLAVGMAAAFGAVLGLREKILRYKAAMTLALSGVVLSPLGIWLGGIIPNRPLAGIFSLVLLYVSVRMYLNVRRESVGNDVDLDGVGPPCILDSVRGKLIWTVPCFRALLVSGVLMGFLSGLLGVGGGFVIVPALKKCTDLSPKMIVATSLGVIALVSTMGVIGATLHGSLQWAVALPFSAGTVLGLLLGRRIATRMSGPVLQQIFAVFAFCVALSMMAKALF